MCEAMSQAMSDAMCQAVCEAMCEACLKQCLVLAFTPSLPYARCLSKKDGVVVGIVGIGLLVGGARLALYRGIDGTRHVSAYKIQDKRHVVEHTGSL